MRFKVNKEERSWILYDVANSAFILMATAVFPIYFKFLADDAGLAGNVSTAYWGFAIAFSTLVVAILAPSLGAMGDYRGRKKRLFVFTLVVGFIGCLLLAVAYHWVFYLAAFIVARLGFSTSLIYYDGMLVDVSTDDRMDMVSTLGYGYGYIGSCIPFIFCIGLILFTPFGMTDTMAMALSCLVTALWWMLFSIPMLKNCKQKYYLEKPDNYIKESIQRPIQTIKKLKTGEYKKIMLFTLAYFCYIDGVFTIISMSTSYGYEVGISDTQLILALLMTQFVAFPSAIITGKLAQKLDTLKILRALVLVYVFVCVFAFQLDKTWEFWFLGFMVGLAQGGIQSLSRSYFGKIIPKKEASEFFGFFDIFGKFADVIGPIIVGGMGILFGASKYGILAIVVLFIVGYILLGKVRKIDQEEQEQDASIQKVV